MVKQAQAIRYQGRSAYRLTVDFKNKGRVTLNTAIAQLERHEAGTLPLAGSGQHHGERTGMTANSTTGGWLSQLENSSGSGSANELWDLPDNLKDPFLSDQQRLKNTFDTYYYSTDAGRLLEWAQMQTGLDDPMTRYTRQELEQAFPRFARDRDNHLFDLIRTLKRANMTQGLHRLADQSRNPRQAKSMLDKALRA